MGKKERIYELEQELANVKGSNAVLEAWRKGWIAQFDDKAGSLQSTMAALTQLWGMMGAQHQTDAVMKLEQIKREAALGKAYNDLVRETNQTTSSLRHQIFTLETAQRQLVNDREAAIRSRDEQGYAFAAKDGRIEELERALRGILGAFDAGDLRDNAVTSDKAVDFDLVRHILGDDHAEV